jgi:hypothetical protein
MYFDLENYVWSVNYLWTVKCDYLCTTMKCTILWNMGFRNVQRESRFLFFCFCQLLSETRFCYTHHYEWSSVTCFLSTRCYHLTSVMRFLSTRRCHLTTVMRFLSTRHCYLHISDTFLCVTNLFTSQTQCKWRVFSVSLMTLWTRH